MNTFRFYKRVVLILSARRMIEDKPHSKSMAAVLMIASLLVFVSGLPYHALVSRMEGAVKAAPIASDALLRFPMQIGDWAGQAIPLDETIVGKTGSDAHIIRRYSRRQGLEIVSLYIVCGIDATHLIAHRPEVCYLGTGRSLVDRRVLELFPNGDEKLPCTILRFTRSGLDAERVTVLNYFVVDGCYCADASDARSQAGLRYTRAGYVAQVQVVGSTDALADEAVTGLVRSFAVDSAPFIFRLFKNIEHERVAQPFSDSKDGGHTP